MSVGCWVCLLKCDRLCRFTSSKVEVSYDLACQCILLFPDFILGYTINFGENKESTAGILFDWTIGFCHYTLSILSKYWSFDVCKLCISFTSGASLL